MNLQELKRRQEQDPENLEVAVEILRTRMRSGELAENHVVWAAQLGDDAARILFPRVEKFEVSSVLHKINNRLFCVKLAIWCAKKSLHIWEEKYPNDSRPHNAIERAEDCLEVNSEINQVHARAEAERALVGIGHLDKASQGVADSASWAAFIASLISKRDCSVTFVDGAYESLAGAAYALANDSSTSRYSSTGKKLVTEILLIEYLLK